MGFSVGNLAVAVATVVVLGFSIAVGRSANLDVVSGPNCNGTVATDGKTVGYIAGALTELGAVTPVKGGGHNKNCKFPDGKSGSISGSASCRDGAALLECIACLGKAEGKLVDQCKNRTEASVQLQGCQIQYAKIK